MIIDCDASHFCGVGITLCVFMILVNKFVNYITTFMVVCKTDQWECYSLHILHY